MSQRAQYGLALGVCAIGAGLVLLAAGRPWVEAVVPQSPGLPGTETELAGRDVAGAAAALGLAGLAAVGALVATRGRVRRVVGLLVLLIGAGAAIATVRGPGDGADSALADRYPGSEITASTTTAWWVVSLTGAVLLTLGGALALNRGHRWPSLSARYDAPGTAPSPQQTRADDQATLWEALDRGDDPTA